MRHLRLDCSPFGLCSEQKGGWEDLRGSPHPKAHHMLSTLLPHRFGSTGGLGEGEGMTWAPYRPETCTLEKLVAAGQMCHKSEQLLALTDRSRGAPLR